MQNQQAAPPGPSPIPQNNLAGLQQQSLSGAANLPYHKTVVGMLKISSIILGFIAMMVSLIGYFTGTWFQQLEYGVLCNPKKDLKCTKFFTTEDTDRNYAIYPETICRFLKENKLEGITNETACPSRWYVVPQVFIFAHTWGATFIVFVILLKVDLSKNRAFIQFDVIGHAIAALVTILSGVSIFAFFGVANKNDNCNSGDTKKENICKTIVGRVYRLQYMSSGGILTVFTGIIYLVIVVIAKRRRMGPTLMFNQSMGQGQMQQVYPSQYPVQQSPSTPSNAANPSEAPANA